MKEYQNSAFGGNPFVITDHVEFDVKGRAFCPCCAPNHQNKSKTLSLVPNTDGAYKCFRDCKPEDIRQALGQPKPAIIPTALAKAQPQSKVTVSEDRIRENCLSILEVSQKMSPLAINWLNERGIDNNIIKKYKLGLTRARSGQKMTYAVTIPIPDGKGEYYQKKRIAPWDKQLQDTDSYRPWSQYGIPKMVYFTHKPANATETWLCEGEWDAIAMAELVIKHREDVAVACFTCGCSAVPPESELKRLLGKVIIFYDRNDKEKNNGTRPGDEGAKKVAAELGERAKIAKVPMPHDCKVKGWDVSDAINNGFIYESFERAAIESEFIGEKLYSAFEKGLRTAKELFDTAPDYVDWLVPDLLTSNELYCLAAEPRAGKSLFALGLAKAIASGGKFLDRPCQQGEVVYICKEDPDDKVKERLIAQEWTEQEMEQVQLHNDFTLDELPGLVQYVREKKPALIILDTLSRVNPNAGAENSAEIVDTLAPLQNLAQRENVCVLVVHHTRKKSNVETDILDIFDSVRGSGAIRATCRGMLVLCKAKDSYRLAVENGRTTVQDLKVHLNVANLTWLLNGLWSPPAINLTQKETVIEWFEKHLKGSVEEVSNSTAIRKKYIYELLTRLANDKVLKKVGRQRNTMYYYDKVPQVPQVEDEWNYPNPDTERDRDKFHKSSTDPLNCDQSDQLCNRMLNSDHVDHFSEGKEDFVELEDKLYQSTATNIVSEVPQEFHKVPLVELEKEKVINSACAENLPDPENAVLHPNCDQLAANNIVLSSFEELEERQDDIVGVYHKDGTYYRFIRLQGKRIFVSRSGLSKEKYVTWNGLTGKVELKADE